MKRFYREVSLVEDAAGWRITLDTRPIRTQGGRAQVVPSHALAEAMAAEWAGQGETIDPRGFVLRDLADFALDVIAPDPAALCRTLAGFAETDTLCYRAYPDEPLAPHQAERWDPLVAAAEARFGVTFTRTAGVIHRAQPPETIARLHAHLATLDPFALAALNTLTTLTASLIIGLAALDATAPIDTLWQAANLEELWQADLWGHDPEAAARRDRRAGEFAMAARFAELVRQG